MRNFQLTWIPLENHGNVLTVILKTPSLCCHDVSERYIWSLCLCTHPGTLFSPIVGSLSTLQEGGEIPRQGMIRAPSLVLAWKLALCLFQPLPLWSLQTLWAPTLDTLPRDHSPGPWAPGVLGPLTCSDSPWPPACGPLLSPLLTTGLKPDSLWLLTTPAASSPELTGVSSGHLPCYRMWEQTRPNCLK